MGQPPNLAFQTDAADTATWRSWNESTAPRTRRNSSIISPPAASTRWLNEVVRGRRRITADTATRLSSLLQTSPQFWMRLQADWDLHQAMERTAS